MQTTTKALSDEQQAFLHEFLVDLNATKAALRSGCKPDEARSAGSLLLRTPEVTRAVAEALVRRFDRTMGLGSMLRKVVTGAVPIRRAVKFMVRVALAKAGYAVIRLPRAKDNSAPPGDGVPTGNANLLHVYVKGKCFYCQGESPAAPRILRGGEWDSHLKRILHKVCAKRKEGTVVEIGANIGASFLPECAALPEFKFALIEPIPTFFEILKKNVASLEPPNVVLHNLAVSDGGVSDVVIIHDDVSGGIAAAGSILRRHRVAIVQSVSLDEMFPSENVILLKADVDGYELDVLRGGRDLIMRNKPDVVFEFQPTVIEARGFSPLDLPNFLADAGVGTFDLYTEEGNFIETTANPARLFEAFRAQRKPAGYMDVHAYPAPLGQSRAGDAAN